YIFEIGPDDNSAEHDDEQSCDGIFHNLFALYRCSSKRQIRRRQLLFLNRFWRTIRAIPLIELGSEMGVILNLFAQLVKLEVCHRLLRIYQNIQFTPNVLGRDDVNDMSTVW